jgi:hypothetical protein
VKRRSRRQTSSPDHAAISKPLNKYDQRATDTSANAKSQGAIISHAAMIQRSTTAHP